MPETTFEPFLVHGATLPFRATRTEATRTEGAPTGTRTRFDPGGRAAVPDALVADARDRARAEGWAAGRAEGLAAAHEEIQGAHEAAVLARDTALAEARADLAQAVGAVRAAAAALAARREATAAELVDHVVDAVAAVLEATLGHTLARGEDSALDALRRALAPLPGTGPAVVALSTADARVLHGAAHLLEATTTVGGREVTVVTDPTLARGDATATSGAATVEVRLAEAVARAAAALTS